LNKSKAIVLLITLFFISAISILILKNLSDSEEFINISNTTTNLTQTNITIYNVKNEVMKLFKDKKDDVDMLLATLPNNLPLSYENIKIQINIKEIYPDELYNLNDVNLSRNIDSNMSENIDYTHDFFSIIKDKNITNNRQIDFIVDKYISLTKDTKILNIKEKFTYIDFNDSNATYISCKYDIDVGGLKSNSNVVFKVGDLNETSFDFYFKN